MSNLILTPLQLWESYDPLAEPLQISIENYDDKGSYYYIKGFFNAENCEDGVVRVAFNGRIPKVRCKNVAIVVDEKGIDRDMDEVGSVVNVDYGILFYDYIGEGGNAQHTIYPESLKYANIKYAGDHLTKAIPSAKETCGFIWTKVLRRMITLAQQIFGDNSNVFLIGKKGGADIVWQAAAMDSRVKGIVTIFNAGWTEYSFDKEDIVKELEETEEEKEARIAEEEERERWLTGCATQTYARFVKCPILFIGASNSDQTPLDRLGNTISAISGTDNIKEFISPGVSDSVDRSAYILIKEWLKKTAGEEYLPDAPKYDIFEKDGKIYVSLDYEGNSTKAEEVIAYVSYNETDPRVRNWKRVFMGKGTNEVALPIIEDAKKIFVYLNAKYEEGYYLSSPMFTFDLDGLDIERVRLKKSHIIFEKKLGIDNWIIEQEGNTISGVPKLKAGAYDIMGVTYHRGDLSTYLIAETAHIGAESNILQFDYYCEEDRTVCIELDTYEDDQLVKYTCNMELKGSKEWQKIPLELQYFKTQEMVPLKEWGQVKKLTFKDIQGILIGNILWL